MKKNAIRLLLAGVVVLFMAGCGESDDDPVLEVSGVVLDQSTLELEVEQTGTLVATLQPEGVTGDVTWSSSDPAKATVNEGVVTALSAGGVTIVASHGAFTASCAVTVSPKPVDMGEAGERLEGTHYTIIQLDEASFELIQDKVDNDLRPDDINKFMYVWDGTFANGTSNGPNFFGRTDGWISLVVGGAGWSGSGFYVGPDYGQIDMTDMYNNPDDYVFHIAMKSTQPSSSYLFLFNDGSAEAKICVGSAAYDDGGTIYEPYADFSRDGEWTSIEIPAGKLRDLGVFYNQQFTDINIFAFLAGGIAGTTMDFDACFFYKKPAN